MPNNSYGMLKASKLTYVTNIRDIRFQLTSAETEISGSHGGEYEDDIFLDVVPCSLVEVYRRFRGDCRHLLTRRNIPEDNYHQYRLGKGSFNGNNDKDRDLD
jgi:hypothetical protein